MKITNIFEMCYQIKMKCNNNTSGHV